MELFDNWQEEKRSAYLYQTLATAEKDKIHQHLFKELAKVAEKQASIWEKQILEAGMLQPVFKPDNKAKLMAWLVRKLGARPLRIALAAMKVRGMSVFHGHLVSHPLPTSIQDVGRRHQTIKNGGNIRAAVFGISDGLLSNTSLILGMAGANVNHHMLLLSGIAGLLAGACSMGSGEYISVRSQREMLEYQIALEKHELETYPEEEAAELALIYEARGLPQQEAEKIAQILIKDPERALDTLAREELGINPDELVSPWGAAISSFTAFALGAFIPLLPFICLDSKNNLLISIGLTGLAMFGVGAILSLFTQKSAVLNGMRVLLIGFAAGGLTYLIGNLFGGAI